MFLQDVNVVLHRVSLAMVKRGELQGGCRDSEETYELAYSCGKYMCSGGFRLFCFKVKHVSGCKMLLEDAGSLLALQEHELFRSFMSDILRMCLTFQLQRLPSLM